MEALLLNPRRPHRGLGRALALLGVALALSAAGCLGSSGPSLSDGDSEFPDDVRSLVAVNSDYMSTSLSLFEPDEGRMIRDNFLNSGSETPGLTLALSGDIVLPASPMSDGRIWLIDRYPNGVLTVVDPRTGEVERQISVNTGFPSNPQDLLDLGDGRGAVTRYETNLHPGREPHDEGDDLLLIDLQTGEILGRRAPWSPDDSLPQRPVRMARSGDRIFVSLARLNRSFDSAAPGAAWVFPLGLDRPELARRVDLPEGRVNCTGLTLSDEPGRVLFTCLGLFQDGREEQVRRSGLVEVSWDESEDSGASETLLSAEEIGSPLTSQVAVLPGFVFFTTFGQLDPPVPDRLYLYRRSDGAVELVEEGRVGFSFGGLLTDPATNRIFLCDADEEDPKLRIYRLADGVVRPVRTLRTNPSVGLPPREVGRIGLDP